MDTVFYFKNIDERLDFWKPVGCVVNSASGWNNFDGSAFGSVPDWDEERLAEFNRIANKMMINCKCR